jgi:uncharacterized protein (DUF1330 family)
MSVYLIADIKVTDDGWVPEYAANVHNCKRQLSPTGFSA